MNLEESATKKKKWVCDGSGLEEAEQCTNERDLEETEDFIGGFTIDPSLLAYYRYNLVLPIFSISSLQ